MLCLRQRVPQRHRACSGAHITPGGPLPTASQLKAEGGASLIRVTGVTSTTSRGIGALIQASGEKGLIEVENTVADEFSLTGQDGSVKVVDVTCRDTMKASSVSGNVIMSGLKLALRASVQVETTSGAVTVSLTEFAGFVSLHSSGSITVKNSDDSQWNDVQVSLGAGRALLCCRGDCCIVLCRVVLWRSGPQRQVPTLTYFCAVG